VLRKDDEKDKRRARAVKREEMIAAARDQKSEFEFGKPYEKTRKHSKFDFGEDLDVIPVEIEIDSFLHSLIENQILENTGVDKISLEEWVNFCFKERMDQILTDPREFGKITLNPIRTLYCLPQVDYISSNRGNQQK
jgi:hypothetical protein